MAIDWKQPISLATITDLVRSKGKGGSSSGGSSAYPSKTTMNLYQGDKREKDAKKTIVVGVLLAIGIALFAKFGVIDRLALVSQKEGELATEQQTLSTIKEAASEYEELKEVYDAYTLSYGSGSIDPAVVLALVDDYVMPSAEVTNIVAADGKLTLKLNDTTLKKAGSIANKLKKQDVVQSVNVNSATNQNSGSKESTTTITVTFVTTATSGEEG